MEPSKLGPFNVVRKLGEGGMGAVYEGENAQGQRVAIKLLSTAVSGRRGIRERFELEIETLRKLDHPNIVKLYGFGEQDGQLYYTMEMVAGVNLEDKLAAGYRFKWREAAKIGVFLCRALQHAHDRGIVHRDIKPENVMLTNQGRVKLADFGIARIWGVSNVTNPGGLIGTANYMSPEQASGQPVSPRSDMYSLGMSLYALIVGRPAFIGDSLPQLLKMHIEAKPKSLTAIAPDVPEAFDKLIMRLLTKEAEKRIANPEALARRLEDLLRDEGRQAKEKAKRLNEMGEEGGNKNFASFDDEVKKPRESSIRAPSISPDQNRKIPQATDVADDDLGKTIIATGGKPKLPPPPSMMPPSEETAGKLTELPKSLEPYEPDEPTAPGPGKKKSEAKAKVKSETKKKVQPPTVPTQPETPQDIAGGELDLNLDDDDETEPRMAPRRKQTSPPIEAPPGLDLDLEDSFEVPPGSHMPYANESAEAEAQASSFYSTKAQADAYEAEMRQKEADETPRRIEINGTLVGAFILCMIGVGVLYLLFKPVSADKLLARLEPLRGTTNYHKLVDAESDVKLFLNKYLEHEKTKEMEDLLVEVEVAKFVVKPGKRLGWSADDIATAELITGAIITSQVNPEVGLAQLNAALDMHVDQVEKLASGGELDVTERRMEKSLNLGIRHRKKLRRQVNDSRAGQLKHLATQLKEARIFKTVDPRKSEVMLKAILLVYAHKSWASEKVTEAKELLKELKEAPAEGNAPIDATEQEDKKLNLSESEAEQSVVEN